MAFVFKVYDSKLDRFAALKVIRKDAFPPDIYDKLKKRFENEARAMAKLSHHAIVKVYEYGEFEEFPYLIMELVDGGSLKQHLGHPLPEKEAASFLASIADGLNYAHRNGVLHRDVKPSNILIRKDGSPVLTDFGIAKIIEERDAEEGTLTETGMGLGTPEYMAPEQSFGLKVDGRADQYSLGIVFYEMLTGVKPFSGDTALEIMMKQHQGSFSDPKKINPAITKQASSVIARSLSKSPDERYKKMSDFTAALKALSKGVPDTALIFPQHENKGFKKFIIAGVLLLMLLAAGGSFLYFKNRDNKTKTDILSPLLLQSTSETETADPTNTVISFQKLTEIFTEAPSNTPASASVVQPTDTPAAVITAVPTEFFTETFTLAPSDTPTPTVTFTPTETATSTFTAAPTDTPTATSTLKPTQTPTATFTLTPTNTPTLTFTPTLTPTQTVTATATATFTPSPTATPQLIEVGPGKQFYTLDDVWRGLTSDSGRLHVMLDNISQITGIIQVPEDKGITEVILDAEDKLSINCAGARLYANGIPLTVSKNLTLSGLTIFGGGYAVGSVEKSYENSRIDIYGVVSDVYAGGEIRGADAHQGIMTVNNANLLIFGTVLHNIYGGGYAVGKGSVSHVEDSHLFLDKRAQINGTAYYGGYADAINESNSDSGAGQQTDTYSLEHGKVTMGTVYADIRGNVRFGVKRSSLSAKSSDQKDPDFYNPAFQYIEPDLSQVENEDHKQVKQEMLIAWGQECADLNCAMTKIDPDTTDLDIKISCGYAENYAILIPYFGNSLERVTIDADSPVVINMQNQSIYANGIHLTIGENITLSNSTVYAGSKPESGTDKKDSCELTIKGKVGTVYAGGFAACPDCISDISDVQVTVTETGDILGSLYGGGYAAGAGAKSLNGTTTLILAKNAKVRGNLIFGGSAANYGVSQIGQVNSAVYCDVTGETIEGGLSTDAAVSTVGELQYTEAPDPSMMEIQNPQIIRVGDYEVHKTLRHALQAIRYPGGDVIIELTGKLNVTEDIVTPANKAIHSITFTSSQENVTRSIDLMTHMFFANGVPVTFNKDIIVVNGPVFAGGLVNSGKETIHEASLTIEGIVKNNIYGGSASIGNSVLNDVCIAEVENTNLIITGTVQSNVFLGGYSIGSGSKANTTGTAKVILASTGEIQGNLYFGGNSQSVKDLELVDYCDRKKSTTGECSYESINISTSVNYTEAAVYGTVLGSIVHAGQSGSEKTSAYLKSFSYVETSEKFMEVSDPQEIHVGPYEKFTSFRQALQAIHYTDEGTDVIISVNGNLFAAEDLEIPYEMNIRSLQIVSDRPGMNRTVDFGGKSLFAGGVPLTIGENILMSNTAVFAGKLIKNEVSGETDDLTLTAENGSVTVLGMVSQLYAGGKAVGPMTGSVVNESAIDILGAVHGNVYGGGAAVNGAYTLVDQANIHLGPESNVSGNLYCGGYAEITEDSGISGEALFCYSTIEACSQQADDAACRAGFDGHQYCVSGLGRGADNTYSFSEVSAVDLMIEIPFDSEHIMESPLVRNGGDGFVGSVNYEIINSGVH